MTPDNPWIWPLAVTLLGAGAGLFAALRAIRSQSSQAITQEGLREDLDYARETTVDALRALDMEQSKLDPGDYQKERAALLRHGAAALRQLDTRATGHPPEPTPPAGDPMSNDPLREALEAQRETLGQARYDAIMSLLDSAPTRPPADVPTAPTIPITKPKVPAPQPKAEPLVAPPSAITLSPRWEGALYAFGACLVAVGVYFAVVGAEQPKVDMPAASAMAPQGRPAVQPSAQVIAWQSALEADPNNLEALNGLTFYELHREGTNQAAEYNRRALAIAPNNPDALTYQALLAYVAGNPTDAMTQLDQVLAEHPNHSRALEFKGIFLLNEGQFAKAAAAFEQGLANNPSETSATQMRRALAYARSQLNKQTPNNAAETGGAQVLVKAVITLDEGLPASFPPGAVMYASIKSPQGGPPVVAKKLPAGPFPMTIELTEADKIPMMGNRPVPDPFQLVIRIDVDGDPISKDPSEPQFQDSNRSASSEVLPVVLALP